MLTLGRRGCRPSAGPKLRPCRGGASRCARRPASTQNRGPFVNGPYSGTSVPSVGVGVLDDPALQRSPPRIPRANPHRVRLFSPPLCKGRCPSAHTGGVMREKVRPSHSFDARNTLVSAVGTAISRPRDALSVPQNSRANPHRVRLFSPPLCKGRCRRRSPARR